MKTITFEISKRLADTILAVALLIVTAIVVQHIKIKQSKEVQDIQHRLKVLIKQNLTLRL